MVLLSILSNASTHYLITEIFYERREKERVETIYIYIYIARTTRGDVPSLFLIFVYFLLFNK